MKLFQYCSMIFTKKIILVFSALALFGLTATAATSKFGGAYELTDSTTAHCNNANTLTGECLCSGAGAPSYDFRLINDAPGQGQLQGANVEMCSPGTADTSSEFAGAYLIDDSPTCRASNLLTGQCTCPVNTSTLQLRTLLDGSAGIGGAHINVCMRISSTPALFGGAFQQDDPAAGGSGCRASNPDTGACSCPVNFKAQQLRAVVDGSSGFIGSTISVCVPANPVVQLCTVSGQAVTADSSGATSASAALQSCIDNTPSGGTYELPVGKYLITSQIVLSKPITLRTQDTASSTVTCHGTVPCATLFASPQLVVGNGILAFGVYGTAINGVTIDHIILDGNRAARLGSNPAYVQCQNGQNQYGFNANTKGDNFTLMYSISTNALCGTSWGYSGSNATIKNNIFSNNGDNSISQTWSDGLTIARTSGSSIVNNQFIDNSDVGFVIGGAQNSLIQNNIVNQTNMRSFAGLMLNSMGGHDPDSGIFTGATISGNTITCAVNKCHIAFNIGDHAWDPSLTLAPVVGGTISNNTVTGGVLGLNIDGAGSTAAPVTFSGNVVGARVSLPAVSCGVHQSGNILPSRFNIGPDAKVTAGTIGDTQQIVHNCNGS